MKRKPASETATFTPSRFASLTGRDRHEITTRLSEIGASPVSSDGRGDHYALKALVNAACGGDIKAEQLRRTREEADRLALQNARSRGELVEVQAVKKLGERIMIAIRSKILSFPITDDEKDALLRELFELGKLDWSRDG